MTHKCVADDQYGQLWRRLEEVARRVREGTIPFDPTMDVLQRLIESSTSSPARPIFPVTVDYTHSLAQMIAAGKYDWVNSDITDQHFPPPSIPTGLPPSTGSGQATKAELKLELVHFNRTISSNDAIAELKQKGLRPATLPEFLAFGAIYPEEQRKYPIVALGSVWQYWDGDRDVPFLYCGDSRRGLSLGWFEFGWYDDFRFAVVRK